jgi:omega-6 fatty acid desaturase (delta-12 desaturase)
VRSKMGCKMNKFKYLEQEIDHNFIRQQLKKYCYADNRKAIAQLANTFALLALVLTLLTVSYRTQNFWACAALIPLCSLCFLRLFVLQHDCGHHTFFTNKRANNIVGFLLGILNFTPLLEWRHSHNLHHATNGHLEKRGMGDVWMMTCEEYQNSSRFKKLHYQIYRNPLVLFVIGPFCYFVFRRRFCVGINSSMKREYFELKLMNISIFIFYSALAYFLGWKPLVFIGVPMFMLSAGMGVWLFYVQHVFEDAYWERSPNWNFYDAALDGSTFYDLPAVLHWFSASIGYHHIHHLESRIPNYHLKRCMEENRHLFHMPVARLSDTFRLMRLKLWDEKNHKYVRFGT